MNNSAVLSEDRRYRYTLERWWDVSLPPAMFIGMNPSTADENDDDPTIRRCMRFARDWGYGGLLMGNLYALRATNPRELTTAVTKPHPISPIAEYEKEQSHYDYVNKNDRMLKWMRERAGIAIAAWGSIKEPPYWERAPYITKKLAPLHALGFTKNGHPRHPLYMRADARPIPMSR